MATNIFVQERAPLPNGDRLVEIFAVIEQGRSRADYSELTATPAEGGRASRTYVTGKVSANDRARVADVKRHVRQIVNQIAEGVPYDVTRQESEAELPRHDGNVSRGGKNARWLRYDDAYDAVTEHRLAGTFAWFGHPYGSFEHEACSHPIGFDGPLTVTRHLEVEGLPGLYLAGPGNFVRPGAANPALTILAMSRFLAATISAAYQ
jgi:choline dehydrogenase-like flavoprotein